MSADNAIIVLKEKGKYTAFHVFASSLPQTIQELKQEYSPIAEGQDLENVIKEANTFAEWTEYGVYIVEKSKDYPPSKLIELKAKDAQEVSDIVNKMSQFLS